MTINVLIGGSLPRLLREITQTLVRDEPDIHVAAAGLSAVEMLDHIGKYPTDVVIVGCDKAQIDEVSRGLLEGIRRTKVIAVAATDCDAFLYHLTPVSRRLGQLSTDSLLCAIRSDGVGPRDAG